MAFVWLLVLAFSLPVFAQERLTATVDKNTVRVGETFTLTVTFEGAASGVSEPQLPALDKLQRVGGPFTSTSFTLANGRTSSTAAFSYVFRALEPGKSVIGAATAKYRGKDLSSNPVAISILAASAPAPARGTGGSGGSGGSGDVFIRVFPDKTTASLGEQITLTYKLYFAVQITSPEIVQLPRATGFWVEEIAMPQNLPITDEVVSGRGYKVAVIRKSALFATAAGDLEVEPMVIQTKIEKRSKRRSPDPFDIFNDPFFQLGRQFDPLQLSSPGVTLHVKPLPQSGVPADFNGAVGSYKVRAALDRVQCKTDDAVTLTVEIEGTGNIKTLPEPKMTIPADVQRFDPEVTDDIRRNQTRIGGRKIFKYVIIPRAPGLQVIPATNFSFYDPDRDRYASVSTADLRLQVEKGTGARVATSGISVASKQGVENVGTDIAFAKTNAGRFVSSSGMPHQNAFFWIWTTAPWATVAAIGIATRNQRRGGARVLRRGALKNAARHTVQAEKALKAAKGETVLWHTANALEYLVTAAIGKPSTGMTRPEIETEWQTLSLDPALLEKLQYVQDECDRARFTTGHTSAENMRNLLRELNVVVKDVERTDGRAGGKR